MCMWGLFCDVLKTNGSVVIKTPHLDINVWKPRIRQCMLFSLTLPLCVRVNFLTERSKSSKFALLLLLLCYKLSSVLTFL